MIKKKIRVLVVDDSLIFRELISRGLSTDPMIEVVAKASDAYEAWDKVLQFEPDVMTCDIRMPKMDGIDFIGKFLPQRNMPIIMVSTISDAVFDALNAGAVDFVSKPDINTVGDVEQFIVDLIYKVKGASQAKISVNTQLNQQQAKKVENLKVELPNDSNRIIAIASSTGGTEAVFSILSNLPPNLPGIVIVQHIPPKFSALFADRLNRQTNLSVKEAVTGEYVQDGYVYIAPGEKHIKIIKSARGYKIECFGGDRVNGHCPSADILFESVAKAASDKAIGVILTGMGYDGAKGLLAMRRRGARTIGQDEDTSIVYGMPKVASQIGAVEVQCAIKRIPSQILKFLK